MPKKDTHKKRKLEIPDVLLQLKSTFEAVNIFYAFCDARLTTSVTLQSLQKSIPNLTLQDLAAINVIIPDFVKFKSLSMATIEIEFGRPVSKKASKDKHIQALANRGDVWNNFSKKETVVKPNAIKKMIEQQNKLFEKAIPIFLNTCKEKVCF
jgi:DEAD/DEAH box helicase domain-containing protein